MHSICIWEELCKTASLMLGHVQWTKPSAHSQAQSLMFTMHANSISGAWNCGTWSLRHYPRWPQDGWVDGWGMWLNSDTSSRLPLPPPPPPPHTPTHHIPLREMEKKNDKRKYKKSEAVIRIGFWEGQNVNLARTSVIRYARRGRWTPKSLKDGQKQDCQIFAFLSHFFFFFLFFLFSFFFFSGWGRRQNLA